MSKDPAFLFYPNDWQGGTMTFSRHLKGCYIDLLVAQFNSGPLSLEEIKTVLGNDFAAWGALSKKFTKDASGLFSNERLTAEKAKRNEFSINQSGRAKSGWNKRKNKSGTQSGNAPAYANNEDGNGNEDEDLNENKKGVQGEKTDPPLPPRKAKPFIPPTVEQVIEYFRQNDYAESLAKQAFEYYDKANPPWSYQRDGRTILITSWKGKMQTWFKNNEKNGITKTGQSGQRVNNTADIKRRSLDALEAVAGEVLRQAGGTHL